MVGVVGRYRGARAEVVAVETVPTPSGSTTIVVRIRRPRAGDSYAFPGELRREEEPKPEKRELADPELFPTT